MATPSLSIINTTLSCLGSYRTVILEGISLTNSTAFLLVSTVVNESGLKYSATYLTPLQVFIISDMVRLTDSVPLDLQLALKQNHFISPLLFETLNEFFPPHVRQSPLHESAPFRTCFAIAPVIFIWQYLLYSLFGCVT